MSVVQSRRAAPALAVALWVGAGLAWGQASAPSIPFRSAMSGETPEPQQWLLAVLGCALLLVGLIFVIRRFGARLPLRQAQQRYTTVLERTMLAQGAQLMVVEYGERRLLLSVTSAGSTCLRDDPANALEPPQPEGARK